MPANGWGKRGPCPSPNCDSSDGCVEHSDGYSFCFSCKTRFEPNQIKSNNSHVITNINILKISKDSYLFFYFLTN